MAVFDLDGTLVNSLFDLAESVNKALVSAGLEPKPIKNYNKYIGKGRDFLITSAMGEYSKDEDLFKLVRNIFSEEYARHCCDNTTAYECCSEMLKVLEKNGIKTAVLSNKPDEFIEKVLSKTYPEHKFAEAWGQRSEYKRKPSGEALLAILKAHNINKNECIYVGDSYIDVLTALDAGVQMAGVSWGFGDTTELIQAGAGYIAETAEELIKHIFANE